MKTEKAVLEINMNDLLPNRFQPRIKFNEAAIKELSESIKEHGVIQPIVVRRIGDKYEIIAGERRYKASLMAGKISIPAIVADLDDVESAEVALIENVQRQDLTPIEEAISYKKILDMGYTQEKLAKKLGNKQSTIANKLRLLNLPEEVQEALLDEKISERHARSLLRLEDQNQQIEMLEKIVKERLTVRKTDEEIDKMFGKLFKKKEKTVEVPEVKTEEMPIEQNIIPPSEEVNVNIPLESVPTVPLQPVPTVPFESDMGDDNDYVSGNFFGITNENIKIEPVELENVPSIDTTEKVEIPETQTPTVPSFEELFSKSAPVSPVEEPTQKTEDFSIFNQPEIKSVPLEPTFESVEESTPKVEDLPIFNQPVVQPVSLENYNDIVSEETEELETFSTSMEPVQAEELVATPTFELPIEDEPLLPTVEEVNETPVFDVSSPILIPDDDFEEINIEPKIEESTEDFSTVEDLNLEPQVEESVETPSFEDFPAVEEINIEPKIKESTEDLSTVEDLNLEPQVEESVDTPSFEELPALEELNLEPKIEEPTAEIKEETVQKDLYSFDLEEEPNLEAMGLTKEALEERFVVKDTFDIEKVTSEINKCKEILEGIGLNVRLEEFDFEDMYQVIISINK